jgi:exonuclease VII small subunit
LATYERGIALYRRCQLALEQAEQRVSLVNNGNTENLTAFRESDEP